MRIINARCWRNRIGCRWNSASLFQAGRAERPRPGSLEKIKPEKTSLLRNEENRIVVTLTISHPHACRGNTIAVQLAERKLDSEAARADDSSVPGRCDESLTG